MNLIIFNYILIENFLVVEHIELRALFLFIKDPNIEPGLTSFDLTLFFKQGLLILAGIASSHDPTTFALK
jgi:hypothetical protein